jgi:triacylglycerol lipase
MKKKTLAPHLAASLAKDVYALTEQLNLNLAYEQLNKTYNGVFDFEQNNLLKAKTGGPGLIKCKTAFGFTLIGKGPLAGNAFILVRGTQYLADWLTNLNVLHSRSCGFNQPVHDGFNMAFKTMLPQIREFAKFIQSQNVHTVHCIGHSLGGALATLCGEWVKSNMGVAPIIYTFGSPRVGFEGFASSCVREIGANNIFRAYHKTDVVPCIPIWPYVHTPNDGTEYYLPSPGVLPGAEYHSMTHYIDSVKNKTWDALAGQKQEQKTDTSIMAWLQNQTPASVTIKVIEWIDAAIQFVIRKIVGAGAWLISSALGTSATIMDRLAYILANGINLEEKISNWVMLLIRKIQEFLGGVSKLKKENLNREFIKLVLTRLQTRLNVMAQNALSQALVQGRAIN